MTPEERQLITGLFDRLRGFNLPEKDREAEALINESMVSVRDAPYMLVQSVLVQEQALKQGDSRIKELEDKVRALESAAQQRSSGSGSFLGGLFGSRPSAEQPYEPARGPSVPAVGARAAPSVYDRPTSPAWSQQPPPGQPGGPFAQGGPAGGGFLQSALSTAAGVAGGVLAANAISNMLGGHSAHAGTAAAAQPAAATSDSQAKDDAYQDGYQDAQDDQDAADDAAQDAADDDGGWFGGDGGGDLDI